MTVINLNISVSDITAALASFDVTTVERSITLDTGPYVGLTATSQTSATLLGTETGTFNISGQTLSLLIDSQEQLDVVFAGADPQTTAVVVGQINAAAGATVAFDDTNAIRITSSLLGSASKVEVVGGSASATLGFAAGTRNVGLEAYIPLVPTVSAYGFADKDGEPGFYYRVRFYNTVNGLYSLYSPPFQGAPGTQIGGAGLSLCFINLVDPRGVAVQGQRITFFSINEPLQVEGFSVAIQRAPVSMVTNNAGHAEIPLVRGLKLRAVFEGTSLIRDIEVPDTATFDLLTVVSVAPDIFDVVVPNLPAAPRRTL